MVIKVVDLGCEKCHKKIKKILCKIPQIQSQIYAEKENTVTITVVCCSPEKIKRKLLRKGCGFIECVVIKPPPPPTTTTPDSSKTSKPDSSKTSKPDSSSKTSKPDSSSKQTPPPPPPPIKHEVNVTIRNTCCNECNEGSCGQWCHCHSMSQPPCWIIPRHAQSCKGGGKLRITMIGVSVQHQPLDSNPVVMMDS
ncbi:HEAVY METAL TRANSPORT/DETOXIFICATION SUPERFAMILY PROTEIN [Salix viminalis]|nr:HEAVY METAL TRANSPORT/DETOXIFICATION SUPERFAMILY PROTEIN [Salix viminalis]